jgi:hypothetical protein
MFLVCMKHFGRVTVSGCQEHYGITLVYSHMSFFKFDRTIGFMSEAHAQTYICYD